MSLHWKNLKYFSSTARENISVPSPDKEMDRGNFNLQVVPYGQMKPGMKFTYPTVKAFRCFPPKASLKDR